METETQEGLIKETDYILIIENRGNRIISNLKKDKTVQLRKKKIKLKEIVGLPYNSTFEVDKNGNVKLVPDEQADAFLEGESDGDDDEKEEERQPAKDDKDEQRDNRDMVDDNKAQKLTFEEIDQLKSQGVGGKEIISKLIENSESFTKRTAFSQEKYLLKKKRKHLLQFKAQQVTLDNLVETYFLKNPSYTMSFRFDSYALFLHLSSIQPQSRILLFENTHGLLLAGIRQRLGTDGEIHVCSPRPQKQDIKEFRIVNEIGFTNEDIKNVNLITVKDLEANPGTKYSHLLISSEISPTEILAATVNHLIGGATIVIYNSFIEPLGDCFEYLKQHNMGINMNIREIFSREQQVLPNRTHPHMNMASYSGYIFSGNKTIN